MRISVAARDVCFFGTAFTLDALKVNKAWHRKHISKANLKLIQDYVWDNPHRWELEAVDHWRDDQGKYWQDYQVATTVQACSIGYTWDWQRQALAELLQGVNHNHVTAVEAVLRIAR